MSVDPRHLGAKCDACPLKECGPPVMPEDNAGARFAVVSDCASDHEQREGRPVVGPAGTLFTQMMSSAGAKRKDVHWNMVALCRPPDNDMGRLVERIRKENQKVTKENSERKKAGLDGLPLQLTPAECCAPRLWHDLSKFENVIAMGGMATRSIVHSTASVMNIRGAPTEVDKFGRTLKVMPVLHPSFVIRAQRWRHVLQNDLNRAVRWFRGAMRWKPPEIIYHPDAYTLRKFLSDPNVPYWTYDVETDGIESLTANLRCIGIGTPEKVVIVGYAPIKQGHPPFYTDAEQHAVTEVLREFFADPTRLKAGHNAGVYDKLVIENHLGVTPTPILDTILLHRLVESELPHNLGFVGSMYTDAPSWKTDREGRKLAYGSETDHELHEYCAYDVAVTAAVVPPLFEQTRLREQNHLIQSDHALQVVCAEMHKVGMFVDQEVRGEWETKLVALVEKHRTGLRDISGMEKLNPGSTFQLRDLLFEKWRLEPPVEDEVRFTTSGDPSTSDEVLRSCLTIKGLGDVQRKAIEHIRYFRKAQKLLGTYVVKLRYNTDLAELGWDDEDEQSEKENRQIYGDQKKGIVDPRTGRMHPGYNAHVAVTGRLSSSKPINAQNFPAKLRNMVKAQPGHVLVGADADQLELRIAASRWESRLYLDALTAGADPHASTALAVFEDRFKTAEGYPGGHWDGRLFIPNGEGKWGGAAKNLRNIAKGVQYSSQYWAEVETVHRVIAQTEVDNGDGTTTLPYLHITLREVRMMHNKWLDGAKFAAGWDREMEAYRNDGFISEPVLGRRRDFLDGESRNEVVNFPIQASGASLMNIALLQVAEQIPLHKWGLGTGIVNQCHDAIVVECPADGCEYDAETKKWKVPKGSIPWQVKHIIEEAMNLQHRGLPNVKFTATAEIGLRWNEV